jgi:hypothetical protein
MMNKRWKRRFLSLGLIALIGGIALGCLAFFLRQVPSFYTHAVITAGAERREISDECQRKASSMWSSFGNGDDSWNMLLTETHINSYFQESFESLGGDKNLPAGFSEPRLDLEKDTLRVGCRYGKGQFSTICSLELKVWLVAEELNTVAVEIVSMKAGSLCLSPRWTLDPLSELARKWNAELTWYRRDGNPVAIVKLQAGQLRPTFQIQRLEIQQDQLVVVGQSQNSKIKVTSR